MPCWVLWHEKGVMGRWRSCCHLGRVASMSKGAWMGARPEAESYNNILLGCSRTESKCR